MPGLKRGLFGYSSASVHAVLADRERMFERASRQAQSADERAERLASELRETQRSLGETEKHLRSVQEPCEKLAADLERSNSEREAMEVQVLELHQDLTDLRSRLAVAESAVAGKDEELRVAAERTAVLEVDLATRVRERDDLAQQVSSAQEASAELEQTLRQRNQLLVVAQEGASKARAWLLRAREDSARYKRSLTAKQQRVAELEELLATYRAELEGQAAAATPATAAARTPETTEPAKGPSTAGELAAVLQVTEEAVVRIIESTRARADQELRSADEDRERILLEVESMKAWRDRAAPMISSLQSTVDEVLGHVSEIGVRVGDVLRPVAGAVARLSSQLASLDSLSSATAGPAESPPGTGDGARVIELRDEQTAGRDAWREQ